MWSLAIAGFIAIVAFAGFETTFSLLAERRFDLTEGGVSAVFVGIGLLLVAVQGGLIAPITGRLGSRGALRTGLGLNVAGLALLAAASSWAVLVPALILLTFGQGLVTPNLTTIVSTSVPDHQRGEALGFQQGVTAIGRIAGPALAGVLFDHVAIGAPYVVGAALCGLALVVLLSGAEQAPSMVGSSGSPI